MIQQIKQKVSIESRYLDGGIEDHIFDKLKKTMEGTCTLDNGYIMTVEKIIVLGDNTIGRANSFVIFDVTYEATILKPLKGDAMSGKVCMVFKHGIFVDISGKMKVLIPAASMIGYSYCSDDNTFQNDDDVIVQDVEIDIEIVLTKYEKKQFSCIGKLCSVDVIDTESESDSDSDSD